MTGSRWKSSLWPIIVAVVAVNRLLDIPLGWGMFISAFAGFSSFWIDKLWLGLYDAKPENKDEK